MAKRMYRVQFENFEGGQWVRNYAQRDVCVAGGAEQAIKVATQRERHPGARLRAEAVTLLASED